MSSLVQAVRDRVVYSSGYLEGRSFAIPRSLTDIYGFLVSKLMHLVSLPLPFLSFLVIPFFSGSSTTISLVFFYLTWSAFVFSNSPLMVELYGTLAARLVCFVIPALGFVAFDSVSSQLARSIKNRGPKALPLAQFERNKLFEVIGVALFNTSLAIAIEALLESTATGVLHMRSIFRVTSVVPLPWNILKDVAVGFFFRGILHYFAHRFLLHTYDTPLKTWHRQWQHSISLPFSLVAAYDHPVNYLVAQWLPMFTPAYLGRYHVLTWHLFVALCSLEELFIFSGYASLPSRIVLLGMARRTDEHFAVVDEGKAAGNFGRWGVMDFICGTTCAKEDTAVEDLRKEAEKHKVKNRAENAIDGAAEGLKTKSKGRGGGKGLGRSSKN